MYLGINKLQVTSMVEVRSNSRPNDIRSVLQERSTWAICVCLSVCWSVFMRMSYHNYVVLQATKNLHHRWIQSWAMCISI